MTDKRGRGAARFYSRMLALYPEEHRLEYGPDMVQLFADRYRDERPTGDVFRFARFWGGMVGDLLRTALAERTESVVSSFKQNWWKWAIGLFAAFQAVFAIEAGIAVLVRDDTLGTPSGFLRVLDLIIPVIGATGLIVGLRLLKSQPRAASVLLALGLLPIALAGVVFFWFPPMYLVSVFGIYLIVRVFMEAGRITRMSAATA